MKTFDVYQEPWIDENGHKHRRIHVGSVNARNILSAVKKAKRQFKQIRHSGISLIVCGMNGKPPKYEEIKA